MLLLNNTNIATLSRSLFDVMGFFSWKLRSQFLMPMSHQTKEIHVEEREF